MDLKLEELIDKNFRENIYSDKFSKLGDSLTNFVFSLSITKSKKKFEAKNVSNYVLSESLKKSKFSFLIKRRQTRHKKGNIVEAILLYCWIKKNMDIQNMVKILSEKMRFSESRNEQKQLFISSFIFLLDKIYEKMRENEILGD